MMQRIKPEITEDGLLISRFQRGEAEAFDRLMAAHTDKVFALAWGVLGNREDAIDAAQEVFIKLYKALPKFPASDNLGAWLYRVCLNHCIDRKRRAKNTGVEMAIEDWERLRGSEKDEPEFCAYQSETGRMIRKAVEQLPERQRLVFTLRHYNLLSISEIACALNCTDGAIKAHLSRATAHLRDRLAGTVVLEIGGVGKNEM
ncbi:MAG: sigma-70 family RNA polymerase sigma factor [Armatimonadetes bacterium]|nr:sigma-70 family RNA polymerase sigma factor [Armatimonadota bacterium]